MTAAVATISPQATLTDAAAAMIADKIGALPVHDQTALIGIITESDLLRAFLASAGN
jgi:CBS domain-containing protein